MNSHGLGQNTLAFLKDRVVRICLIVDLAPPADSTDNPGVRQLLQFPLRRSLRSFGLSDQIPEIEFLVGTSIGAPARSGGSGLRDV